MTPRRGDDNQSGSDQLDGSEGCLLNNISVKSGNSSDETQQVREEICAVTASSETDKEQTSGKAQLFGFCSLNILDNRI